MLKIVNVPNKILTTPAKPVEIIDKKILDLVLDMEEILVSQTDPPGVGMAAPQVGRDIRLFIIKPNPKKNTRVFINPEILKLETISIDAKSQKTDGKISEVKKVNKQTSKKRKRKTPLEGCLSVPRIWSPIKRNTRLQLKYQDLEAKEKTEWFDGFDAIIIQHEVDHLNGILFTQRALEQKSLLFEEKDGKLEKLDY